MNENVLILIAVLVIFGIGGFWSSIKAGRQLQAEAELTKAMIQQGLSIEEMYQILKMQPGRDPYGVFRPSPNRKDDHDPWYDTELVKSLGTQNLSVKCIAQLMDMFFPLQEWDKPAILEAIQSILENGKFGEEALIVVMERLTRGRIPKTPPVEEDLSPETKPVSPTPEIRPEVGLEMR
jgi:hypothetical protein